MIIDILDLESEELEILDTTLEYLSDPQVSKSPTPIAKICRNIGVENSPSNLALINKVLTKLDLVDVTTSSGGVDFFTMNHNGFKVHTNGGILYIYEQLEEEHTKTQAKENLDRQSKKWGIIGNKWTLLISLLALTVSIIALIKSW